MLLKTAEGDKKVTGFGQGVYNTVAGSLGLASFLGAGANGMGLFNLGGTPTAVPVDQREFFNYQLADQKTMYENLMGINDKICALSAKQEASEAIIAKNFEIEQLRSNYEMALLKGYTDAQIAEKTCGVIRGETVLPLDRLANTFKATDNFLQTYSVNPYGCGWDACGYGYNF